MKAKVALYYDWLNQWGGAEQVLLDLIEIFPDAPVYTLVWDKNRTKWLPKKTKVITSFLDKLPFSKKNPIFLTWLYPLAIEQFNFSDYDVVVATTSTVGQAILTPVKTKSVCYFHNVNRHVYGLKYPLLEPLLKIYRHNDRILGQRPDYVWCNSKTVAERIKTVYRREAKVIYPGIDTKKFKANNTNKTNYYLAVGRLVGHKRMDLAINACKVLKRNLIVAGEGRLENQLRLMADNNIKILGKVSQSELIDLYQNCCGLICPQVEDFGLTPLEAQACGKGVIAYRRGGITETVIDNVSGVFFNEQSVESLTKAILKYEKIGIKPENCLKNGQRFSRKSFMLNFKKAISSLVNETK